MSTKTVVTKKKPVTKFATESAADFDPPPPVASDALDARQHVEDGLGAVRYGYRALAELSRTLPAGNMEAEAWVVALLGELRKAEEAFEELNTCNRIRAFDAAQKGGAR